MSATAAAGMIAALFTAVIIRGADRRHAMLGLAALSIIGNAVPIVTSNVASLVVARAAMGMAVGGFWALSTGVVGRLVPSGGIRRAMGIIMVGVSVATIAAPPAGAYITVLFGWRAAFGLALALSVLALFSQLIVLPRLPASETVSLATLARIARRRAIIMSILTTVAIAGGHFASFTYVRAVLQDLGGLTPTAAAAMLLAYGVSNFAGSLVGAALADRKLLLLVGGVALVIGLSTLGIVGFGRHPVSVAASICLWGFGFGAAPVALLTWMTRGAPDSLEGMGSLFTAVFQISVALGAAAGGAVIDRFGATATLLVTGMLGLAAVAPLFILRKSRKRFD